MMSSLYLPFGIFSGIRTICSLIRLPSSSIVRILLLIVGRPIVSAAEGPSYWREHEILFVKLTSRYLFTQIRWNQVAGQCLTFRQDNSPMVVMKLGVHASSQNRSKRQDLPTPKPRTAYNAWDSEDGRTIETFVQRQSEEYVQSANVSVP